MDSKKECDIDLGYMECEEGRGRPRKRWSHDLEEDLGVMQVGRWWEKVRSKGEWRRIVRGPRPTPGCNAEEEEEEEEENETWLNFFQNLWLQKDAALITKHSAHKTRDYITFDKLTTVLQRSKMAAPGEDGVHMELFKYAGKDLL
jgi:hypothetical protein